MKFCTPIKFGRFAREIYEDIDLYEEQQRKKQFNDVRLEIKNQVCSRIFDSEKLCEHIDFLHTNRLYVGRLFLENEGIKINNMAFNYVTRVKSLEYLSCRYLEKILRESKVKSYKCPEEGYANFFDYRIIRDKEEKETWCVHPQISFFCGEKVFYGDINNFNENNGNQMINIKMSHISDLGSVEKLVLDEVKTSLDYKDCRVLYELTDILNENFTKNRTGMTWLSNFKQDSYEDSST